MARKALGRLQNLALSRAFSSWVERLDERREVLERVSRVARRWRMIGASRAFREWADVSAQRSRKRQLMQRFAYRALNADVARAWATWQERTREHKLMQLVLARHLNGLLFKTFVAWHYLMRSRGGGGRISRFGRWYWNIEHAMAMWLWARLRRRRRAARPASSRRRRDDDDDYDDEYDEYERRPPAYGAGGHEAAWRRHDTHPPLPAMDGPFVSRPAPMRHDSSLIARQAVDEYREQERRKEAEARQASRRINAPDGSSSAYLYLPPYSRDAEPSSASRGYDSGVGVGIDPYRMPSSDLPRARPTSARPPRPRSGWSGDPSAIPSRGY